MISRKWSSQRKVLSGVRRGLRSSIGTISSTICSAGFPQWQISPASALDHVVFSFLKSISTMPFVGAGTMISFSSPPERTALFEMASPSVKKPALLVAVV
jgi:hypothetical protein